MFAPDGKLFVTLGERFKFPPAQDLTNDLGKIVRINPDGSVPKDNPFVGKQGGAAGDLVLRPPQPARRRDSSRDRKAVGDEIGPRGGDELNIPQAGTNYGWPVVSWGGIITGRSQIPDPPTHPEFADAIRHWTPVISPSGIEFYTGDAVPRLERRPADRRVDRAGDHPPGAGRHQCRGEHRIALGARIRDVAQGARRRGLPGLDRRGNGEIYGLRSKIRPNDAPVRKIGPRGPLRLPPCLKRHA